MWVSVLAGLITTLQPAAQIKGMYVLLMMANKLEIHVALQSGPTYSLLLVSHGELVHVHTCILSWKQSKGFKLGRLYMYT